MPGRNLLRTIALLALIQAACFAPRAARADRSGWRAMQTGHFHLYSALNESKTRDVARQLEAFEQMVVAFVKPTDPLPDIPTSIFILDGRDFQNYAAPRPGLGGFFTEGRYDNLLVINGDMPFEYVRVTVFHEYTHFIQRNTSTQRYPPWYTEGFAELFSGFKLGKDEFTMGGLPNGVQVDMHEWIPVQRLLAVKDTDPEYRKEMLAHQFYGESWILVHMLVWDDNDLYIPTFNYLRNLNMGFPEDEAFRAFPFDKQTLDANLQRFIRKARIRVVHVRLKKPLDTDEAPITRVSAAQADAALARLVIMLHRPKEIIDPLLAAALKENAADPALLALKARVAAQRREPFDIEAPAAYLASAAGANAPSADPQVRIDVAAALLAAPTSRGVAERACALLDDLANGERAPIEAVLLWASCQQSGTTGAERMLPVLKRANARVPHDTHVLRTLAYAGEIIGQKSDARDYYNQIILVSDDTDERLWAQKEADSERLQ